MKCSVLFGWLAALVAVFAAVWTNVLDEHTKKVVLYEVKTLALAPIFQIGWRSGIMVPMITHDLDGSGFRYLKLVTSKDYFSVVREFEAKADDVYIVTFPKSGTHFIAQLVSDMVTNGKEYESFNHKVLGLDFERFHSDFNPLCKADPKIVNLRNVREFFPSRAVFATHMWPGHVPYSDDAKYIVVMRNPVDVLASGLNMISNGLGPRLAPPIEAFYELIFPEAPSGWAQFNLECWNRRNKPNYLFLFYEDAVKNHKETVEKVADFLGLSPLDPEVLERVRFRSSLEYMKPRNAMFEPPKCMEPEFLAKPESGVGMINKGKVGSGKATVPIELRKRIKEQYLRVFEGTDFPIERYLNSIE